ncbi:MAG: VOC family protein [Rhizobiales bacterium]|nr:VOC family protein [Hyphomicrobiales bacterium]
MLDIVKFDHIGIRISNRDKSVNFYETLGFEMVADGGFEKGYPLVMLHPSGININLLGPATHKVGENVLMDEPVKYPGITHIALQVSNAEATEKLMTDNNIAITGRRDFGGTKTIFVRDPDRTVLELVGPGLPAASLIVKHVNSNKN